MGLSGEKPLGEAKTKTPSSDYHKNEPTVAARRAEVARDNLKRTVRIDKVNGHSLGSDGPIVTALKRYNGGRVLIFVMGAFAEMSSRICDIIAHDLARTLVSYYNDDAKRTKGIYRQHIQKAWGHTAHRCWARPPPQPRPGPHHPRPGAPRRQRRSDDDGRGRPGRPLSFQPPREGGLPRCQGTRSHGYCCLLRSNPRELRKRKLRVLSSCGDWPLRLSLAAALRYF